MRVARVMVPHAMRLDDAAMPVPGSGEAFVRAERRGPDILKAVIRV